MCYDINNDSTQNVHDEGEKVAMETNMHSKKQLKEALICLGIKPGDKVLIHSSYKSLGGIEEGAAGFFEVVMDLLGTEGTLILPTLTFRPVYETKFFDVRETPSCVGYLTEYFRTQVEGVVRSLHPTHSCAVWGKDAPAFVENHEKDDTPVGAHSPISRLPLAGGKILMLGCSADHNTSLHGVEEAGGAPYVLNKNGEPVCYTVRDAQGREFVQKVYRHTIGPRYAQRYARVIPLLDQDEVRMGKVLDADCVLMSAPAVWKKGVEMLAKEPYYFVEPIK